MAEGWIEPGRAAILEEELTEDEELWREDDGADGLQALAVEDHDLLLDAD